MFESKGIIEDQAKIPLLNSNGMLVPSIPLLPNTHQGAWELCPQFRSAEKDELYCLTNRHGILEHLFQSDGTLKLYCLTNPMPIPLDIFFLIIHDCRVNKPVHRNMPWRVYDDVCVIYSWSKQLRHPSYQAVQYTRKWPNECCNLQSQ